MISIRKDSFSQRKIYLSMILSYTVAFFVPLLIACVGFVFIVNLLNVQVSETYKTTLFRLRSITDANLDNIKDIGRLISRSEIVYSLKTLDRLDTSEQRIGLLNLKSELDAQILINDLIDSIYVTIPGNSIIVSSDGFFHMDDYDGQQYNKVKLTASQWRNLASFEGFSQTTLLPDGRGNSTIVVTYKDNSQPDLINTAAVTLILNSEKVQNLLDSLKLTTDCNVMILGNKNHFLSSTNESLKVADLDLSKLEYNSLIVNQENFINHTQFTATYVASEEAEWLYVFLSPRNLYSKQMLAALVVILIYILLCGVIGALLIPRVINRHYSPLKRLVNTLATHDTRIKSNVTHANLVKDEYSVIEDSLDHILSKMLSSEKKLSTHTTLLTNKALNQIISGRIKHSDDIDLILENNQLNFIHPKYSVIVFSIDDFGNLGTKTDEQINSSQDASTSLDFVNFVLISAINEIIQEAFPCYTIEMDEFVVSLLNIPDSLINQDLENMALNVTRSVHQKFDVSMTASIGRITQSCSKIHSSYLDAIQAIHFNQTMGTSEHVTAYESESNLRAIGDNWTTFSDHELQLMNLIQVENYRGAKDLILRIVHQDIGCGDKNAKNVKIKMAALINVITMSLNRIAVNPDQIFNENDNPMPFLLNADSVPKLKESVITLFDSLIDYVERQKSMKPNRQGEIISYVKQNFKDQNLTVSSIADHFGISIGYISRMFKSLTGLGLLDYVHLMRIESAKALLRDSNYSVKQIAERVGYSNTLTMTRAFRRFEGITPSDFKGIS